MKPLSLLSSLPYFAIPAAVMTFVTYVSIPYIDSIGLPLIWNFMLHFIPILGGLGVFAIVFGIRERESGQSLWQRLWLTPCWSSDILLGIVIGGIGLWAYLQLQVTVPSIMSLLPVSPPQWLIRFRGEGTFLDIQLVGNWWILGLYGVFYLCNVLGEEVWWRGYILPRQIKSLGRWAWLANGLLWASFHVFFAWDIIALIPIALLLAIVTQWRRSTWVAVMGHGVLNSLPWFFLISNMTGQ